MIRCSSMAVFTPLVVNLPSLHTSFYYSFKCPVTFILQSNDRTASVGWRPHYSLSISLLQDHNVITPHSPEVASFLLISCWFSVVARLRTIIWCCAQKGG